MIKRIVISLICIFVCVFRVSAGGDICYSAKTYYEVSENNCVTAMDYYNLIPRDIRNSFEKSDWVWYVYENGSLAGKYNYPVEIMGMTDWKHHEITVDRRDSSQEAIIHEIGHWSNHLYNNGINVRYINAAYDSEWQALYKEFGGSVKNYDTVEEFGASAFEYFIIEPERLEKVAPYTYTLMSMFISGSSEACSDSAPVISKGNSGGERITDDSYDYNKVKIEVAMK